MVDRKAARPVSRRAIVFGLPFIPACGKYYPRVEAGDLDPASPTIQPDSTPENFTPPTAVPPTPTPNFALTRVAILEAQAALNAAELEQAKAQLKAKEGQSTTTPVPPAPTLRPTSIPSSTPLPPTATRIPPTATRALPSSTPTPNESSLLDQHARTYALGIWMTQFLQEYGKPPTQARPNEDTFYINGYQLDLEGKKLIRSDDEKQLRANLEPLNQFITRFREGQPSQDKNRLTAYWGTISASHYTGMGKVIKLVEGMAELKDIRVNISQKDSLSRTDIANDVRWRGKVKLDYLFRTRANYAVAYSLPVVQVPDHNYSDWGEEAKTIGIEIGKANGEDYLKNDFIQPNIGYRIPLDIILRLGGQGVMFVRECDQAVCKYPK